MSGNMISSKDRQSLLKWLISMGFLLSLLFYVSTNIVSISVINGNSMYPTIKNGETHLVDRINTLPEHGDIVLIEISSSSNTHYIVKRVIATGGEKITIDYDANSVYLNGVILPEPYINQEECDPMRMSQDIGVIEYVVPDGFVFVMGDNRNHSVDSRNKGIGLISQDEIIGKIISLGT